MLFDENLNGSFFLSVWSTRAKAEAEMKHFTDGGWRNLMVDEIQVDPVLDGVYALQEEEHK
jgi:hypothetical protein